MKFLFNFFHQTALYEAIEANNHEIVKLLLTRKDIDINIITILNQLFCLFDFILN